MSVLVGLEFNSWVFPRSCKLVMLPSYQEHVVWKSFRDYVIPNAKTKHNQMIPDFEQTQSRRYKTAVVIKRHQNTYRRSGRHFTGGGGGGKHLP